MLQHVHGDHGICAHDVGKYPANQATTPTSDHQGNRDAVCTEELADEVAIIKRQLALVRQGLP